MITSLSTSTLSNSIITKHRKTLLVVVALYSFIQKGKTWTACFYPFLLNQLYNKTSTQNNIIRKREIMFSGAAIASSTKPVLIATGLITLANPVMTNKFNQSRCDEYNGLLIFFFTAMT